MNRLHIASIAIIIVFSLMGCQTTPVQDEQNETPPVDWKQTIVFVPSADGAMVAAYHFPSLIPQNPQNQPVGSEFPDPVDTGQDENDTHEETAPSPTPTPSPSPTPTPTPDTRNYNYGWGLAFDTIDEKGSLEFFCVSNAENSSLLGKIKITGPKGTITDITNITPSGGIAGHEEDQESLWLADIAGNSLLKLDKKSGALISLYQDIPFPAENRKLSGIALGKGDKMYASMETVLLPGEENENTEPTFIRILEVDLESNTTRVLAYPHDSKRYLDGTTAIIGGLAGLNSKEFLIIEEGRNKNDKPRTIIYKINISEASDIKDKKTTDGKELETLESKTEIDRLGIQYITKTKVMDLRAAGWTAERTGGIAVIDRNHFAVISENSGNEKKEKTSDLWIIRLPAPLY